MARNGLTLRNKTTQAQEDTAHLTHKKMKNGYKDSDIVVMDETSVWQDMLTDITVDRTGAQTIRLETTGHEKVRISHGLML